jgi:hypothetical protein
MGDLRPVDFKSTLRAGVEPKEVIQLKNSLRALVPIKQFVAISK